MEFIAELVEAAVRDAFCEAGGLILVEVSEQAGEVICGVSDNGDPAHPSAPGRAGGLVRMLAAELGGVVSWRCSPGCRSTVVAFPAELHAAPANGPRPQGAWSAKRWISQAAAGPGGVSVRYIARKA
jgi:hypothetical protein